MVPIPSRHRLVVRCAAAQERCCRPQGWYKQMPQRRHGAIVEVGSHIPRSVDPRLSAVCRGINDRPFRPERTLSLCLWANTHTIFVNRAADNVLIALARSGSVTTSKTISFRFFSGWHAWHPAGLQRFEATPFRDKATVFGILEISIVVPGLKICRPISQPNPPPTRTSEGKRLRPVRRAIVTAKAVPYGQGLGQPTWIPMCDDRRRSPAQDRMYRGK